MLKRISVFILCISITFIVFSTVQAQSQQGISEEDKEVFYAVGEAYLQAGDYENAVLSFQSASGYKDADEKFAGARGAYLEKVVSNVSICLETQQYVIAQDILERAGEIVGYDPLLEAEMILVQGTYKQELIGAIDEALANENLEEAKGYLSVAEQLLGDNDLDIAVRRAQIVGKTQGDVLSLVDEQIQTQQYEVALSILAEAIQTYGEMPALATERARVINLYKTDLKQKAEAAYASEGYERAVEILQSSAKVLPGDSDIMNWISQYRVKVPVWLHTLDILEKRGAYIQKSEKDNYGNEYLQALDLDIYYNSTMNYAYIVYKLNEQYSTLSGTAFVKLEFRSSPLKQTIKIYGDDILLYETPIMGEGAKPVDFNVNVIGVDILKIYADCDYDMGGILEVGNLYLQK